MAQLALSAVGAVIGGVAEGIFTGGVGFAQGAEIGWALGGIAGALIFRQQGPQVTDLRVQDSAYGKAIPLVYGLYRVAGNVIWVGPPTEYSGGKGGPSNGPSVLISLAVGLCKGPINGVRRIWANGVLIYDSTDPSDFQAISGSANMITNFTVYNGDENQYPDPTIEAMEGVGNVPPFRGLAYVVFNELDLNGWGNYIPSLSFEVSVGGEQGAFSATSPYVFTYATSLGTILMCPCLTANGGIAIGYGYYLGYNGLVVANVTPYGNTTEGVLQPLVTPTGSTIYPGNSDTPGILGSGGWFDQYGNFYALPFPNMGADGSEDMFCKNGDDVFKCSSYGGTSYPVYKVNIDSQQLTTSALSQPLAMIGVTASYVYVVNASTNTIYQLNRGDLSTNATWVVPATVQISVGFAYSDDVLYWQGGDSLFMYETQSNTLTTLSGGLSMGNATSMAVINPEFFVFARCTNSTVTMAYATITLTQGQIPVSQIVSDMCSRAGLTSGQYNTETLTDGCWGYAVTNHSSPRSNITPLMSTYFFDSCDTDNVLKFVRRGSQPVGTFLYADLGASNELGDDNNQNPITEVIAQDIDLPRSLTLTYPAYNNDYLPNSQRAFRTATTSNQDMTAKAPIVLADSEALTRVQSMLWASWVGRRTFTFSTRLGYIQYEPGDVMNLQGANGENYIVRITDVTYDGQGCLNWQVTLEEPDIYPNPQTYTAQGGQALGFNKQSIAYSGPTVLAVLDIPPLRDTDSSQQLYLAACGLSAAWPGCSVQVSRDGNSYTDLLNIPNASVIGVAQTALGNFSGGNQPDELNTVTIQTYGTGSLSSVNYANFIAGVNACYLGGELILFRNATLISANTYQLSGFLRGRVGTEYAMGTHVANEQFVFLDPTKLMADAILKTDIGAPMYFETFLSNIFSNMAPTPKSITPASACVKPLSPALFVAGHGSTSATTDITVSWIRRARVNAEWNDGTDVPLDESSETYQLKILSGTSVVRTVVVAGTGDGAAYIYTAANITADGFSTGNTISFSVAQNSDQGVLGNAATTTITR